VIALKLRHPANRAIRTHITGLAAWKTLGRITNDVPVEESRHPGQHALRVPATDELIALAHASTLSILDAFVDALDAGTVY
jgi:hypothetical protein